MSVFWASLGSLIAGLLIGAALGFYFTRKSVQKQLEENPPITEKQIRAMYAQMGRKPSEADIRKIMATMKVNTTAVDSKKKK